MSESRKLTDEELAVIATLLGGGEDSRRHLDSHTNALVIEMDDGGMGSLQFIHGGTSSSGQRFGRQIALGEYMDTDGVPVSLSLNIDESGNLFELDVWKVDFSRRLRWPAAGELRLAETDSAADRFPDDMTR